MTLARTATVFTPLAPGTLLFLSMSGTEALGKPFRYDLDLLSDSDDIDLSKLIRQPILVKLALADDTEREFSGFVSHFSLVGAQGRYVRYRAVLRPQLWFLTQISNCRIFQGSTVPAIVKEVLKNRGVSDVVDALSGSYRPREYLVQYRESDFNFIHRILEDEGIYYYFRHQNGKQELVLSDSYSAHDRTPGFETIPFYAPHETDAADRDHLDDWRVSRQVRPGSYSASDYNFKQPALYLWAESEQPHDPAAPLDFEVFDYPGQFQERAEGTERARVRLEELQSELEVVEASGPVRGLHTGSLFKLRRFPREDQNKEYLVVRSSYQIRVNQYASVDQPDEAPDFRCAISAIDSKHPFRPARATRKPVIEGPQPAFVVGQEDQEIWTDEFGRVKVQFYWDRYGEFNENSSCWIRVSQLWASSGFGGMHLPRIGDEVLVDFLDGDPDRPIVVGRLYNRDNMPPYALPANRTQSGIKSRSSKDGNPDNFNEIRFEDKKGQEELFVQAERNQTTKVKANQSVSVGANQSVSVGGNQNVSVTHDRQTTVTGKDTIDVTKVRKITVTGDVQEIYKAKHTIEVTEAQVLHAKTQEFKAPQGIAIIQADGTKTTLKDGHIEATAATNIELKCTNTHIFLDSGFINLEANTKIQLKVGSTLIQITSSSVEIESTSAKVTCGSSSIALDASGVTITGTMVKLNS